MITTREFAQTLRNECIKHGVPLKTLCEEAGFSEQTLQRWVNGESEATFGNVNASIKALSLLADAPYKLVLEKHAQK